jgi:hypothetical protein
MIKSSEESRVDLFIIGCFELIIKSLSSHWIVKHLVSQACET